MSDSYADQRPEHHIHHSNQPLPGVGGQPPAVDYSVGTLERQPEPAGGWDHVHPHGSGVKAKAHYVEEAATAHTPGHHAPVPQPEHVERAPGERLAGVSEAPERGVAVSGQEGSPTKHASITDKLVGKTEKVLGKVTRNAAMHEKGELRATEGKGAAHAPHD